jgi:hypothetical protein
VDTPPTGRRSIPTRLVGRFAPVEKAEWRRLDNNTKAAYGLQQFLALPDTRAATAELVGEWLVGNGIELGPSRWVEVAITPDLPPRYANVAYSSRSVDAFRVGAGGRLEGCELKVSGDDGVSGLTLSSARLLAAGLIRVYSVNPVRGQIGEMDSQALLGVPRRLDGVPVGEARVAWLEEDAAHPRSPPAR